MVKVTIKAAENGPYIVEVDGQTKAALCRCGASGNKPNCDGTHTKVGFKSEESELKVIE